MYKISNTQAAMRSLLKNLFSDRAKAYFEYDKQFYTFSNPEFKSALNILISIDSLCVKNKIEFIFVSLPYEYQLRVNHKYEQPQKLLLEDLRGKNIKTYNLFNTFASNPIDNKLLYLYADGIHFSNAGHRLAANFILNSVVKQ